MQNKLNDFLPKSERFFLPRLLPVKYIRTIILRYFNLIRFFQQVNCHADVLNCLLDFGASVNKLNDEGLSPLAACHVLHYTNQDFIDNIAENIPKENIFNSIEWDKQRGCYIHRNDKKTILSMYGTIRSTSTSNEITRGKAVRKTSTFSTQGNYLL